MTPKKPTAKRQPLADKVDALPFEQPYLHVGTDIDELIERGNDGDLFALSELYGRASGWIRGGNWPVPEPLGAWIADRLRDVARAIHARREGDIGRVAGIARGGGRDMEAALAVALRTRRAGAKGRRKSPKTEGRDSMIARDVLHFMVNRSMAPSAAIAALHDYYIVKRIPVGIDDKAIAAAWQKHGKKLMAEHGITTAPTARRPSRK